VSGYADGPAASAQFNSPQGLALAADGTLYVSDGGNACIRKVAPDGTVSTLAGDPSLGAAFHDGVGSAARFNMPTALVLNDDKLYVADTWNHAIRSVTLTGTVSTLAGNGHQGLVNSTDGHVAQFYVPIGLAMDSRHNLYVADSWNHVIREVSPDGAVSTFAGSNPGYLDGPLSSAQFLFPYAIVLDEAHNCMYVSDTNNNRIRKIQ
jgi:sugar lactone lactonase YvrE